MATKKRKLDSGAKRGKHYPPQAVVGTVIRPEPNTIEFASKSAAVRAGFTSINYAIRTGKTIKQNGMETSWKFKNQVKDSNNNEKGEMRS